MWTATITEINRTGIFVNFSSDSGETFLRIYPLDFNPDQLNGQIQNEINNAQLADQKMTDALVTYTPYLKVTLTPGDMIPLPPVKTPPII